MKNLISILVLLLTQMVFGQIATAPVAGDGSIGNPYQIVTLENLYWIAATDAVVPNPTQATRSTAYYIQMNDIDASATSTWDGGKGFYRIADGTTVYTGTYDGGEHKITNLVINRPLENQVGLFGYCYSGCSIKNLTLENCNVSGRERTGGLIGLLYHAAANTSVTISNCHVSGTISGYSQAGGLIGYLWEDAGATGGETYNVFVNNCSVSATVSTSNTARLGVLVGQCTGNSSTKNPRISKCFSSGSASSNNTGGNVGGLIGSFDYATISNCYSTASVSGNVGDDAGGGFIGSTSESDIGYCYSTGTVSGFGGGDEYGFMGYYNTPINVHHCYWDTETSGYTNAGISWGVYGKTTAEMKTISTFVDWDFDTIWEIVGGDGTNYPRLRDNPDAALPVELTTFTVKVSGSQAILNWQTATEVNNYGFEIERSTNLQGLADSKEDSNLGGFTSIGFVEGSGNSNSPKEYHFADNEVAAGKYSYRLKQIDIDGSYSYSNEISVETRRGESLPTKFELFQNYPNPFNPVTTIKYSIPVVETPYMASLRVYDILGNEVETLVNEVKEPGIYEVEFDGNKLPSGVYFYELRVDNFRSIKKLLLMK
ncbi:MAG: T9SS type A sorting domain-containing protein [bacterium]